MFNFTNLYECSTHYLLISVIYLVMFTVQHTFCASAVLFHLLQAIITLSIGAHFLTCGNLSISLSKLSDIYINKVTKLKPTGAGWLLVARY